MFYLLTKAPIFLFFLRQSLLLNDSACANKYLRYKQACCIAYKAGAGDYTLTCIFKLI
ncbi:hypothetical protein ES703_71679 [subsurface metagenome]